jgi:3-oxoacyl-[acyl-carrier-protein] synthase II
VVVTGYGAISALGHDAEAHRVSVRQPWSGLRTITRFDASGYPTRFAAEVSEFDPIAHFGRKEARKLDRFTQLAMVASREAVTMASLDVSSMGERTGVLIGSAFGGAESLTAAMTELLSDGPRRLSPFTVPLWVPNMAAGAVAIDLGTKGPVFAPASAFGSSANAIGEGARMIECGRADVVIAGGAEAPICGPLLAGFAAMQSLSRNNDDPERAVKPFDLHRDGCAIGEGAAVLVLEHRDHAIARGATIVAEVAGYGSTTDAFHEVQIAPAAEGLVTAMRQALAESGLPPNEVGYLNAHGTGTTMNDAYETGAIKDVFADAAWSLAISGTKSRTGHLLGAAGALEALIAIQAMEDGIVPSTLNLDTADPECDLDYVPGEARHVNLNAVMSNSMGFGGHNVSLIFSKPASA